MKKFVISFKWILPVFLFLSGIAFSQLEVPVNEFGLKVVNSKSLYLAQVAVNVENTLLNLEGLAPNLRKDVKYATTDNVTKDGHRAIMVLLTSFGMDPGQAKVASGVIERTLTANNRSYSAITGNGARELSNNEMMREDERGLEYDPVPEILIGLGFGILRGLASSLTNAAGGEIDAVKLFTTHGINRRSGSFQSLKASIAKNGIEEPIAVVRSNGRLYVVNGHHRLAAAKELGYTQVPIQEVKLPYQGYFTVDDLKYER